MMTGFDGFGMRETFALLHLLGFLRAMSLAMTA